MGIYGLEKYQDHHPLRWYPLFLVVFSFALAVGFSTFVLYCLIKAKAYIGIAPSPSQWIYRHEAPFCYWFYMALYTFFAGVGIYTFITLLYQFSKSLPLKL